MSMRDRIMRPAADDARAKPSHTRTRASIFLEGAAPSAPAGAAVRHENRASFHLIV